ncbi:hypothetical protein CASFOL_021494 [Castilleja foliolosa]|uniref:Uncharacterized protein n=1 Tax=Castilleja foliolosa TaxID=1961234 RepID=A0ABD3CWP8_9LAMI
MESTSTNPRNDARNGGNLDSNDKTLVLKKCQKNLNPKKTLVINFRRSSGNELFIQTIHGLHNSIPKHITTLDEKYVLRCLESIHNYALRWNFTSNVGNLAVIECSSNMAKLATDLTVSGSQTMVNILNSQLLQKFGSFDCDVNAFDNKYLPEPTHKRDSSISSTNLSFSDQSPSSSAYGSLFSQGTLQFTWRNGLPLLVFTMDGKNEFYVAKLSKVEFSDSEKGLDYVYTFHSSNKKKEFDVQELEMESIAKMLVSTSVKLSDNSEIRETRFALFASSETTSNQVVRKNTRLKTKVVDIFKSIHSHKQRSNSKILEDTCSDNDFLDLSPNLELAAIIVKEVRQNQNKARVGGWGLNFLKRPSPETSTCSGCSTSMNVIIPAGFHGAPRTGGGGPSGLTERWISGGRCDCGGWDTGCPLTIFKSLMDNSEELISLDLFAQGLKTNVPIMKLASFREDMYYIHFESTLSSLQSFAIAAAIIHSRSSLIRSKVYKS